MIVLRIYKSLMISSAKGERNFSKLKPITNCLRSSISQNSLNSLTILAIELDILEKVNFQNVLNDFVFKKILRADIYTYGTLQNYINSKYTIQIVLYFIVGI